MVRELVWHNETTPNEINALYLRLLPKMREVARKGGWALGVHGSMRRDLDIMAMPWRKRHVKPKKLVENLTVVCCNVPWVTAHWFPNEAGGRTAVTVAIGRKAFLDISFM